MPKNKEANELTTLGFDPGTHRIGFGVVRKSGTKLDSPDYGVIEFPSGKQDNRLVILEKEAEKLIQKFRPKAVGIENLYFSKNQKTAISVAEARGVLLLVASRNNLPILEYNPMTIKQRVAGYGGADKKGVLKMVKLLLGIKDFQSLDDASDALAIAIVSVLDFELKNRT